MLKEKKGGQIKNKSMENNYNQNHYPYFERCDEGFTSNLNQSNLVVFESI